jgi:hypothetical protein
MFAKMIIRVFGLIYLLAPNEDIPPNIQFYNATNRNYKANIRFYDADLFGKNPHQIVKAFFSAPYTSFKGSN